MKTNKLYQPHVYALTLLHAFFSDKNGVAPTKCFATPPLYLLNNITTDMTPYHYSHWPQVAI